MLLPALCIVLALLAGVVFALQRLYRRLGAWRFGLLMLGLALLPPLGVAQLRHRFHRQLVPDALHARGPLYVKEDSWGFGPGGNETGLLVFGLPPRVASAIERGGTGYLSALPANVDQHRRDWRGDFHDWQPTPVQPDANWPRNPRSGRLELTDYLCAYGFCIDIDPAVGADATRAVNAPGSYHARGRIGRIVIDPRARRVYYFYNG
jgi:hypothetical protein